VNNKRLTRSKEDRMVAGVCGGIANYLDLDPTLVRLVFVALSLMSGGQGLIIYIIMMLVVPEESSEKAKPKRRAVLEEDEEQSLVRSSIPVPPAEPVADDLFPEDNQTGDNSGLRS